MSDVKRYAVGSYYSEPRPGGITMVMASDYDALAARLAEAEDSLHNAKELLTQAYGVLCAYGVDRSNILERVLMMDAIKLLFLESTPDSAPAALGGLHDPIAFDCAVCGHQFYAMTRRPCPKCHPETVDEVRK